MHGGLEWRVLFIVTICRPWTRRCDFVMKENDISLAEGPLVANIIHSVGEVI